MSKKSLYRASLKRDSISGVVVFLVALPLCLGIAVASHADAFSGIITGIVGGLIVGFLSGSHVSVSGPAASLIAIVADAIDVLSFEAFLLAGVLAGLIQLVLGFARSGAFSNYIPTGVIQGMLTGIGLIIILKQIPHAIGYDKEHEGDFFNYSIADSADGDYFHEILHSMNFAHTGVIIVTLISLAILISYTKFNFLKKLKLLPGALVAVVIGIVINELYALLSPSHVITADHLVELPNPDSAAEFFGHFHMPDFSAITNPDIWVAAATIAAVASIATILTIEAGDRMDPYKRFSDRNTELKAQGVGNMISCFIGGLPMTSVIVRTSANIDAGARTKMAAIFHGVLLLLCVILIPGILNKIPMASLAAVLLMIGFKLASPKVIKKMWNIGLYHFIPFVITAVFVVYLDLLKGVGIGMAVSLIFVLKRYKAKAFKEDIEGENVNITLGKEVSFLNKHSIKKRLNKLPEGATVTINAENANYIGYDILELIKDFQTYRARNRHITVVTKGFQESHGIANT